MPPLDIIGYAPLNGWKQTGASHWAVMESHRFSVNDEGAIEHYTADVRRAVVPPEGWDDYARLYPMMADLVSELRRPPVVEAPAAPAPDIPDPTDPANRTAQQLAVAMGANGQSEGGQAP